MSVLKGINEQSSISQIISAVRYSFQEKEYDEAERLMIFRENKLLTELNDYKKEFDFLKGACGSLKESYSRTALEKLQAVEELLDCKSQLKESALQLDQLNMTCEELHSAASSPDKRYERVAEELKIVKLEREAKVAKMLEELAKKDEEVKKVKEEKETVLGEMAELLAKKDEELKKMKEENEKSLAEMTEKLAKKDGKINQLQTEKNKKLEDLVAKVHLLKEDITKECDVNAMHKKRDQETLLDTMPGESSDQNFPRTDSSRNGRGAKNPNSPLEGEHPNGETVFAQSSSHHAVAMETDGIGHGKTSPAAAASPTNVPVDKQPLPPLEIIDIISDSEDESPVAKGVSNLICMSDSDDSSFSQHLRENQHVGKAAVDREVQDTNQSKEGNNWFEDFMEVELAKLRNKNEATEEPNEVDTR